MTTLKPIILKVLASAAFKAAIVAKLTAIIMAVLIAAFIKIIGAKVTAACGVASGGASAARCRRWLSPATELWGERRGRQVLRQTAPGRITCR